MLWVLVEGRPASQRLGEVVGVDDRRTTNDERLNSASLHNFQPANACQQSHLLIHSICLTPVLTTKIIV
jgi:hypothetical protein